MLPREYFSPFQVTSGCFAPPADSPGLSTSMAASSVAAGLPPDSSVVFGGVEGSRIEPPPTGRMGDNSIPVRALFSSSELVLGIRLFWRFLLLRRELALLHIHITNRDSFHMGGLHPGC